MSGLVLIYSEEHGAWWRPDSCGYTTNRFEAGAYERSFAQKIVDNDVDRNERIVELTERDHLHRAAPKLLAACEALLLFHSPGPWDQAKADLWLELTGTRDAHTKALCDLARAAVAQARGR